MAYIYWLEEIIERGSSSRINAPVPLHYVKYENLNRLPRVDIVHINNIVEVVWMQEDFDTPNTYWIFPNSIIF